MQNPADTSIIFARNSFLGNWLYSEYNNGRIAKDHSQETGETSNGLTSLYRFWYLYICNSTKQSPHHHIMTLLQASRLKHNKTSVMSMRSPFSKKKTILITANLFEVIFWKITQPVCRILWLNLMHVSVTDTSHCFLFRYKIHLNFVKSN